MEIELNSNKNGSIQIWEKEDAVIDFIWDKYCQVLHWHIDKDLFKQ
jgi:hypothetical protein